MSTQYLSPLLFLYDVVRGAPANRTSGYIIPERPALSSMLHWASLGHWYHCCPKWAGLNAGMQRHTSAHQRSVTCRCQMSV